MAPSDYSSELDLAFAHRPFGKSSAVSRTFRCARLRRRKEYPMKKATVISSFLLAATTLTSSAAFAAYTSIVAASANIAPRTLGSVTVACPAGSILLSGGWLNLLTDVRVITNNPVQLIAGSPPSWMVSAFNYASGGSAQNLTGYAVCGTGMPAGVSVWGSMVSLSIPPQSTGWAEMNCPAGYLATGVGFVESFTQWPVAEHTTRAFHTEIYNNTAYVGFTNISTQDEGLPLASITCTSGLKSFQRIVSSTYTGSNNRYSSWASCPTGTMLSGGGFNTYYDPTDSSMLLYNLPLGSSGWFNYAATSEPWALASMAFCIGL